MIPGILLVAPKPECTSRPSSATSWRRADFKRPDPALDRDYIFECNRRGRKRGDGDRLYVGLGGRGRGQFGGGQGSSPGNLYAIKAGAQGKLTAQKGEARSDAIAWVQAKAGPSAASPLVYQGQVYVLDRSGMLSSFNAQTGKPVFERERLPGGRGFWASPWACAGKVYCLDEDGQTFILAAGREFKVLGKNRVNDMFWSSPAVAGGSLFLRGVDYLYCVKE